jgi:hypothetical protein
MIRKEKETGYFAVLVLPPPNVGQAGEARARAVRRWGPVAFVAIVAFVACVAVVTAPISLFLARPTALTGLRGSEGALGECPPPARSFMTAPLMTRILPAGSAAAAEAARVLRRGGTRRFSDRDGLWARRRRDQWAGGGAPLRGQRPPGLQSAHHAR